MTNHSSHTPPGPDEPGLPTGGGGMNAPAVPEPLYGPAFQQDPAAVYRRLRATFGAAAPVELEPGVHGYILLEHGAIQNASWDTAAWSHDARRWRAWHEGRVPGSSQIAPMMTYRSNVLFQDGAAHQRMRAAVLSSLDQLIAAPDEVAALVERVADHLITRFPPGRGTVDLVAAYTAPLPVLVFASMFGLGPDQGLELLSLLPRLWDADQAEAANIEYEQYMNALVTAKRHHPGPDLTSYLLAAGLSHTEVREHLVLMVGAGCAPSAELMANALRLLLTDPAFDRQVRGGEVAIADALHAVLWRLGPMEIYPWIYPRRDVRIGDQTIPAGTPVGLALAAANLAAAEKGPAGAVPGNRAHLAYGVGPHACPQPARRLAHHIVTTAIQALYMRVDDLKLAVPPEQLHRRPSMFAQALVALPVRYRRALPFPPDTYKLFASPRDGGTCPVPHQTPPAGSSSTPGPGPARPASSSTASRPWPRWMSWGRRRGR